MVATKLSSALGFFFECVFFVCVCFFVLLLLLFCFALFLFFVLFCFVLFFLFFFGGGGLFVVFLLLACLTPQQHASVSQGRICLDKFTCCHTETKVADQTFYLIQSWYTDTGPTSPSADPRTPGFWQGSHCSANV